MSNLEALRAELMANHDEFRSLAEEHRKCEARLQELHAKSLLSQEDEIQEKQIKVHKLRLKDRMEQLLREHRAASVGS
ncbi:MAG TPA: hypothetical protein PK570_01745 [Thermoanaerobaculia bacterium]|nr:DUF465 domain-containing protein [Thermoanaerobaculia bacterium]MBP7812023.1 DUF465 domain-containing protein [Thermoanaerobaculia bacterium]MBP8845419.1 DUF465 domain-containing protein [Thermoanaerobaculia bacterium]HPA95160.1 hypothetical protein [Thermoanaerobaculia bacterium]HQN39807.1 hypothetical protein [Thermoanaerobaculia bacterium]